MRIGVFGGTFDPIHLGHLILAERCREDAGLDRVWFLPSFQPPHKSETALTRFEHRVEMARLAIVSQTAFQVSEIEKELPPPSYTAATLAALKSRFPEDEFLLIVGADCLPDLAGWYQPKRILEQSELIAVPRPGVELWTADRLAKSVGVPRELVRMQAVNCPLIEIASRDLRRRVRDGSSIRFLVPRSVEEYIREKKLYRE